jgi:hypothetical protein
MEGAHFVGQSELVKLSEQQLVSCSKANKGCMGGLMDLGFTYAETTPLTTEAKYPYNGWLGQLEGCKYKDGEGSVGVASFYDVTPNSSEQLKAALDKQPVSVAIEADKPAF